MPATKPRSAALPAVIAALLILGASLLALGVILERAGEQEHATSTSESSAESAEASTGHSEGEAAEGVSSEPGPEGEGERTVLGIPIESPWAIGAFVLVSVALAYLVWRRPSRPVLAAVAVFSLASGIFDVVEIGAQLDAGRSGLALLAGVIAATRLVVLIGAVMLSRPKRFDPTPGEARRERTAQETSSSSADN